MIDWVCLSAGTLILMSETVSDPIQRTGLSSTESKASLSDRILCFLSLDYTNIGILSESIKLISVLNDCLPYSDITNLVRVSTPTRWISRRSVRKDCPNKCLRLMRCQTTAATRMTRYCITQLHNSWTSIQKSAVSWEGIFKSVCTWRGFCSWLCFFIYLWSLDVVISVVMMNLTWEVYCFWMTHIYIWWLFCRMTWSGGQCP